MRLKSGSGGRRCEQARRTVGRRRRRRRRAGAHRQTTTTTTTTTTIASVIVCAIFKTCERKVWIDSKRRLITLLLSSPFGASILKPYLHSHFGQIYFYRKLFSAINIGIVRFLEGSLELVQLKRSKRCSIATMLVLIASCLGAD